jgi:hypothetical protein
MSLQKKKDIEKRTVFLHQCFQNLMEGTNFAKVPAVKQINLLYNINMLRRLAFLSTTTPVYIAHSVGIATPEWTAERDSWEQVIRLRLKTIFLDNADLIFSDCSTFREKLTNLQNDKETPKPLSNLKRYIRPGTTFTNKNLRLGPN